MIHHHRHYLSPSSSLPITFVTQGLINSPRAENFYGIFLSGNVRPKCQTLKEDDEKGECCGNVQSLFFQQMLPRLCPQSQHCSGDIVVNDEENEDIGDDDENDIDDEN